MKPENDVIQKDLVLKQLQHFMRGRRALLSKSCGDNNALAAAYDAGYLACLSELEDLLLNPPKDQDKQNEDEEDIDE